MPSRSFWPRRTRRGAARSSQGAGPDLVALTEHDVTSPHEELECEVERLVPGGLGLVRDEEGVVLLRGGLPGERVRAALTRQKGGARHGRVLEVLRPSKSRVAPDCPAHPRCGGCDLLDLDEREHAEVKRALVLDALARIGRLSPDARKRVAPTRAAPLHARSRRRCKLTVSSLGEPGFFERESHVVVPVEACPALAAPLEEALADLRDEAPLFAGAELFLACDDDGRVSLALGSVPQKEGRALAERAVERGVATGALLFGRRGQVVLEMGDASLFGEVAPGTPGGPYGSDAATFTQATRFGGAAILEEVLRALGPLAGMRVLELFAGAGHLTLPLAVGGARVLAVEGDARAFSWLERNVARAERSDAVTCVRGFIEGGRLDALLGGERSFDALVLDPPRTGVPGFSRLLEEVAPPRLVMVSCDVATGARDLAIARAAGYRLLRLVPIDAFPRTSHVEWVASLEKAGA